MQGSPDKLKPTLLSCQQKLLFRQMIDSTICRRYNTAVLGLATLLALLPNVSVAKSAYNKGDEQAQSSKQQNKQAAPADNQDSNSPKHHKAAITDDVDDDNNDDDKAKKPQPSQDNKKITRTANATNKTDDDEEDQGKPSNPAKTASHEVDATQDDKKLMTNTDKTNHHNRAKLANANKQTEKSSTDDDGEKEEDGITWSAQLNRALLSVKDGVARHNYFVDSSYDNSYVGIKALHSLEDKFKVGGNLRLFVYSASSADVNQLNRIGNSSQQNQLVDIEIAEGWLDSKIGKFSLGKGSLASEQADSITTSGTDLIVYAGVADMAGGMYFHPSNVDRDVVGGDTPDPTVSDSFEEISSLDKKERFRYDSPRFHGFRLSTSIANDPTVNDDYVTVSNKYYTDIALHYEHKTTNFNFLGAAEHSWLSKDSDLQAARHYSGSLSALYLPTGWNVTVAYGRKIPQIKAPSADTPTILQDKRHVSYVMLGKQVKLCRYGKTNFAIDKFLAINSKTDSDRSVAYSVGAVQEFEKINTSFYLGIRKYKYTTPTQDYDPLIAAFLGFNLNLTGKL